MQAILRWATSPWADMKSLMLSEHSRGIGTIDACTGISYKQAEDWIVEDVFDSLVACHMLDKLKNVPLESYLSSSNHLPNISVEDTCG